jgi:predicted transcriptional regulator YdeE
MQCLLDASNFKSNACDSLRRFLAICESKNDVQAVLPDLLACYAQVMSLKFDIGRQFVSSIIRQHRTKLQVKQLNELLTGLGRSDLLVDLMQDLFKDDEANNIEKLLTDVVNQPVSSAAATKSVAQALAAIYKSQEGADFDIVIGDPSNDPQDPSHTTTTIFRCHAFVVASRWRYFNRVISAGMRESHSSKLVLPPITVDGGMHPVALRAILDIIYLGELSDETKQVFDAVVAGSISPLYFESLSGTDEGDATGLFEPLFAFAQFQLDKSINYNNCVSVFAMAMQLGVELTAKRAMKVIASNLQTLLKDTKQQGQLKTLWQEAPETWQLYLDSI